MNTSSACTTIEKEFHDFDPNASIGSDVNYDRSSSLLSSARTSCCGDGGDGGDVADSSSTNTTNRRVEKVLHLMMLGCEESNIYGPNENIANMFMSIFQRVFSKASQMSSMKIRLTIYNAQQKQYPKTKEEWDLYDGIIITGSLSAAYEEKKFDWIQVLMDQIQLNIHPFRRKTIGVCFGHQIYAHSFQCAGHDENSENKSNDGGLALPCPKGMQVGIRTFHSRVSIDGGLDVKKKNTINMLYTHGDMVKSIPNCSLSLGGTDNVPIQACAYFASRKEKDAFNQSMSSLSMSTLSQQVSLDTVEQKPYAFTFQGHPEYASRDVGLETYIEILNYMDTKRKLPHDVLEGAKKDAIDNFEVIEEDCVNLMYTIMSFFGWLDA